MPNSLLTTKLYFPLPRPELVSRPRLVERLRAGLNGPLTLISAPAGSGKTTLLAEWHSGSGSGMPVAWLSLDNEDNDISQFLMYLTSALGTLKAGIGESTLAILQSPQPPTTQFILTALINDLASALSTPFALVLEDYHVINSQPVHDAMTYLLDHLPALMRLVLLTRADPALPLPRLRAHGQLTEIRAADLRFSLDEAASFLNRVMGLSLTSEQVAALEAHTEGWITGLQLAALSMQDQKDVQGFISAFTGSHRYIVDFLAEEVLNRQPEAVRDFLLRTSILDRMVAPLCNVLTNRSDGQEILVNLEHSNLFLIPLDDERRWYRYHHLFADVLRDQLARRYPAKVPGLHEQAADWFKDNHLHDEALIHYLLGNDFDKAALLITDQWLVFKFRSSSLVSESLAKFPDDVIRTYPRLNLIYAWEKWLGGLRDEAEGYVRNAQEALSKGKQFGENSSSFLSLQAEIFAFRSLIQLRQGNLETAVELANQALQIAPTDNYYALGFTYLGLYNAYRGLGRVEEAIQACTQAVAYARLGKSVVSTVDATHNLGQLLKNQGHLHRAYEIYQDGLRIAEQEGLERIPTYSLLHFDLAEILFQWNNLEEAERQLDLGFKLMEQDNILLIAMVGNIVLAQLKRARGNNKNALKVLRDFNLEPLKGQKSSQLDSYMASKTRMQAEMGDVEKALEWTRNQDIGKEDAIGYVAIHKAIQFTRIQIALGKYNEAWDMLYQIIQSAESTGSIHWLIETRMLQAIICQKKNEKDKAEELLLNALQMALQEEYMRLFLDEGEPVRALLCNYERKLGTRLNSVKRGNQEQLKTYVRKLLNAFLRQEEGMDTSARRKSPPGMVEQLSERELQILRLVAEGNSNQQIAAALFIATGTVKKHLNNIFGKLEVQSRTQCVARARELDFL